MGRCQCKNTLKTQRANGSIAVKPGHPNAVEADENNHKNNFMKRIEALKEEMKNSLKEIMGNTSKNWKKSVSSFKKGKEINQTVE